ncbi:MAG: hypothetical protein KKH99_00635, partial [Proteobacteria bacterium]|nr:hypothetical protein [Pseudomonadota bacterium]
LLSESAWLEGSTNPSVSYGYDSYGNQISVTNARGYTSTIEYDIETQTFPVRASKPDTSGPGGEYQISHTVSTTYNYLYAKPASVTDENNRTTYYTYDGFGRSIQTDLPDGGQTQTQYYDDTIPRYTVSKVKETEAAGLVTVGYAFKDGLGRPIQSVTRGKDQYIVSRKYYDTMGRAYKTKGPFFSYDGNWPQEPPETCPWSEAEFDYFGRPTSIKSPGVNGSESAISVLMYSGLKTTAIDPDNSRKEEIKDYLGRVKEVIQYSNTETIHTYYEYNAAKDLLKTTNHFGKQTHLQYDTLGRKIAMQDPDMGDWSYTYDDNGNLLTQTDAKLKITQFTYDELDRPLKKEILNPGPTGDEPVFYEYDNPNIPNGIGRLYTVTKADTQTVYATYDVMGRDREITKIIGDQSYTTSKEYDLSGKMTKLTYPDGYFVTYQYHPGTGLLHNTIGSDNTTQAWFEDYEPTGKIGAIDYGNGAFTTYTYDEATTRLTSIKAFDADAVKLMDKNYTYSKAGDITQIQDDYNNVTHQYTYDALHRLESEQSSNQGGFVAGESVSVMDYQYQQKESDPYHGVSSITHNGQEITYQYDANGNMITSPDIQDLNYTNRLITYNSDNMPVQIIKGGTTVNFTYDGHGTRIAKTVNNGSTTYYIGSHYEIRNGIATKYLFAGNLRIAMIKNNAAVYFHKDHLGSSTVLTDDTGTITNNQQTTYMPYGSISGSSDITDTSYKFTDQEYDGETGLYNYNARLYDPVIGMFISADTIVPDPLNPQTFNRYSYCYNNPLMYVDPSGHWGFNPFKWVGDAVSWLMDDVLGIETLNFGIFAGVGFEVGFDFRDGVSITNFGVGIGEGGYLSIGGWDIDAGASWGAGSYSTVGYDRNMGFYYSESYGFSGGSFSGTYYFGSGNYSVNAGFGYGPASTSVGYSSLGSFSNTVGLMGVSYNTQTGRFGVNVDGNDIQATYENGVNNRTKNGYGAENGNKTFNFIIDYLGTSTAGWEAAEGHDLGYGELGRNKNSIDSTFFTDMVKGSLARLNFQKNGFIKAGIGLFISGPYYAAVGFGGGSAYNAAQQNAYDAALKEIY